MIKVDRLGTAPPAWWRLSAADRRWVTGAAAAAAVLLGSVAVFAWWQSSAIAQARQQLADAERAKAAAAQQAEADARARAAAPAPWWAGIPAAPAGDLSAAEQLSADALALGPKLGVQVQRLTFGQPAATEGSPYRSTAVRAEVRGSYADIKRWIAELLARRPRSLGLKAVDLRRAPESAAAMTSSAPSGSIEASVEWRLFERVPGR